MSTSVWDNVVATAPSISAALYRLYNGKHRYIGRGRWEYFTTNNTWDVDVHKQALIDTLKSSASDVLQRAIYWHNIANQDQTPDVDTMMKVDTLIRIVHKLRSKSGQKAIIKEAKEYFVDY